MERQEGHSKRHASKRHASKRHTRKRPMISGDTRSGEREGGGSFHAAAAFGRGAPDLFFVRLAGPNVSDEGLQPTHLLLTHGSVCWRVRGCIAGSGASPKTWRSW